MLGLVIVAFSGLGPSVETNLTPGPTMAAFPAARPATNAATIACGSARHSYTTSRDATECCSASGKHSALAPSLVKVKRPLANGPLCANDYRLR